MAQYEYSLVFATKQSPSALKAHLHAECIADWRVEKLWRVIPGKLRRYLVHFEWADDARALMGGNVQVRAEIN